MLDWNDLRYFLAVARAGSTLAASKRMRVAQATVSRRIAVLEEALGAILFVRAPHGYSLTQRGEAILPAAETVEAAIESLNVVVDAERRRLTGIVRITTVEGAANEMVIPALGGFRALHPEVRAELIVTERNLDLTRGEADIAIRFGPRPTEDALIIRHLFDLEESVYCQREMVVRLGKPASYADLSRFPLIGFSPDIPSQISDWYADVCADAEFVHRSNTLSGLIAAARSGLGASVMPCLIGDSMKDMVRLFPPVPELKTPGWLVTTDAARQQPHVRAMIDYLVGYITAQGMREGGNLPAIRAA